MGTPRTTRALPDRKAAAITAADMARREEACGSSLRLLEALRRYFANGGKG